LNFCQYLPKPWRRPNDGIWLPPGPPWPLFKKHEGHGEGDGILSTLDTRTFKKVERYFYLYEKIVQAVEEARDNALYGTSHRDKTGGGGHCFLSDPTANRATTLADPIRRVEVDGEIIKRPEDWIKIVEMTRRRYSKTLMGEFIVRRYSRNEDVIKTCNEMAIDRSTYYNWREDIITFAAMACCQAGLMKVYE